MDDFMSQGYNEDQAIHMAIQKQRLKTGKATATKITEKAVTMKTIETPKKPEKTSMTAKAPNPKPKPKPGMPKMLKPPKPPKMNPKPIVRPPRFRTQSSPKPPKPMIVDENMPIPSFADIASGRRRKPPGMLYSSGTVVVTQHVTSATQHVTQVTQQFFHAALIVIGMIAKLKLKALRSRRDREHEEALKILKEIEAALVAKAAAEEKAAEALVKAQDLIRRKIIRKLPRIQAILRWREVKRDFHMCFHFYAFDKHCISHHIRATMGFMFRWSLRRRGAKKLFPPTDSILKALENWKEEVARPLESCSTLDDMMELTRLVMRRYGEINMGNLAKKHRITMLDTMHILFLEACIRRIRVIKTAINTLRVFLRPIGITQPAEEVALFLRIMSSVPICMSFENNLLLNEWSKASKMDKTTAFSLEWLSYLRRRGELPDGVLQDS